MADRYVVGSHSDGTGCGYVSDKQTGAFVTGNDMALLKRIATALNEPTKPASEDDSARLRHEVEQWRRSTRAVWDYVQKYAPWSESNDMDWSDEVITGIGQLIQERDDAKQAPPPAVPAGWNVESLGPLDVRVTSPSGEKWRLSDDDQLSGFFYRFTRAMLAAANKENNNG